MVNRFSYHVEGRYASGETFQTELLVIAASQDDAEDEAIDCLDSFTSIADWSITPSGSEVADDGEDSLYRSRGAFAVYDSNVLSEGN